ncbi:MAG TPA: type II secretion system F family protein [Acidobacteriota bacterium]|nr:type II secretion system F family protein [Acidobacteriota bacterium]
MPVYQFKGKSYDHGSIINGERFAQNKQALAALLRKENIFPINIAERAPKASLPLTGRRVSSKELALFTKQFSVMLEAGLPLVQCLGIMAEQQENQTFRAALVTVREDVESGSTLADALRRHPKVFDNLFVNMIAAGEAGGVLDIILTRLAIFIEKAVKLRRSMLSAMIYPVAVLSFAVIVVFVIMVWVIPVFVTLFQGLDAPLPLPTRIVMQVSAYTRFFAIPIIALAVIGGFGLRSYYGTETGRLAVDSLVLQVPIFGVVLRKIVIARFSRTLATLLNSGIPILDGLEITAHTAGNRLIQDALMLVRKEVAEGKTLVDPMKRSGVFPNMVTQIVGVGEQTGELDQMLSKLADYFEEESDVAIANLLTLMEPLLIIFLGVVVGGIVVSMYLPIFSLISHLAGS